MSGGGRGDTGEPRPSHALAGHTSHVGGEMTVAQAATSRLGCMTAAPSRSAAPGTHPGTEVNLEDGSVHAAAEHVILGKVKSHSHDAHIEEDGKQQLPG